ncbi:hypothetical protein ACU41F_004810 [Klebsiella aerogenes]
MINRTIELWKTTTYTVVPEEIYQRIPGMTEALALFYCRLMDNFLYHTVELEHATYHPTHKELSLRFNIDESTVKSRLTKLKKIGLVVSEKNEGYANNLTIHNYQNLDLMTGQTVKEKIQAHRAERKAIRKEEQEAWKKENITEATEQASEPVKASEASPISEEEILMTDNQIKFYCDITGADFSMTKTALKNEPSAAVPMLELIESHAKEQRVKEEQDRTIRNAIPGRKGTIPERGTKDDEWESIFK